MGRGGGEERTAPVMTAGAEGWKVESEAIKNNAMAKERTATW